VEGIVGATHQYGGLLGNFHIPGTDHFLCAPVLSSQVREIHSFFAGTQIPSGTSITETQTAKVVPINMPKPGTNAESSGFAATINFDE